MMIKIMYKILLLSKRIGSKEINVSVSVIQEIKCVLQIELKLMKDKHVLLCRSCFQAKPKCGTLKFMVYPITSLKQSTGCLVKWFTKQYWLELNTSKDCNFVNTLAILSLVLLCK